MVNIADVTATPAEREWPGEIMIIAGASYLAVMMIGMIALLSVAPEGGTWYLAWLAWAAGGTLVGPLWLYGMVEPKHPHAEARDARPAAGRPVRG